MSERRKGTMFVLEDTTLVGAALSRPSPCGTAEEARLLAEESIGADPSVAAVFDPDAGTLTMKGRRWAGPAAPKPGSRLFLYATATPTDGLHCVPSAPYAAGMGDLCPPRPCADAAEAQRLAATLCGSHHVLLFDPASRQVRVLDRAFTGAAQHNTAADSWAACVTHIYCAGRCTVLVREASESVGSGGLGLRWTGGDSLGQSAPEGLLVAGTEPGSAAFSASLGIRFVHHRLIEAGGAAVSTPQEVEAAARAAEQADGLMQLRFSAPLLRTTLVPGLMLDWAPDGCVRGWVRLGDGGTLSATWDPEWADWHQHLELLDPRGWRVTLGLLELDFAGTAHLLREDELSEPGRFVVVAPVPMSLASGRTLTIASIRKHSSPATGMYSGPTPAEYCEIGADDAVVLRRVRSKPCSGLSGDQHLDATIVRGRLQQDAAGLFIAPSVAARLTRAPGRPETCEVTGVGCAAQEGRVDVRMLHPYALQIDGRDFVLRGDRG
eukprot:TRINITY_DN16145_c0_g1_i1.p1 TRINITY_DN16145_c0_g1~~TRINITY_DN16145_c0_g1_i1.p1  ORF type:complete len:494 (+),score=151.89 TRINITY_DN16145_c0_g1_i1:78-1559(+)